MKKLIIGLISFALLLVIGFGGYVWVALKWSYSAGERAGYVQKFSLKGWMCKTWEGELAMTPVPGAVPERFNFTVRDDAIARRINETLGKRISLSYEQHKGLPTDCFGETEYFVTQIRVLE